MKIFLLGLIAFFSVSARANLLLSIGENNVFEREAYATQYSSRTAIALRIGDQEEANAFFGEYNQFGASDGSSQLQIDRTQREFLAWVRHSFWADQPYQLYLQGAPGVDFEYVKTNFMGQSENVTSKPYLAFAAAAGGAFQYEEFRFEVEFRALTSGQAAPNPTLSVGFYVGYVF